MKIILKKSHKNLGNPGDVVNVKPGFARNFLFPQQIAEIATEANIKALENWLSIQEIKEAKNIWNFQSEIYPSYSDERGSVLVIKKLKFKI